MIEKIISLFILFKIHRMFFWKVYIKFINNRVFINFYFYKLTFKILYNYYKFDQIGATILTIRKSQAILLLKYIIYITSFSKFQICFKKN